MKLFKLCLVEIAYVKPNVNLGTDFGAGGFRNHEETIELRPATTLKSFRDIRHHGHCGPLNLR